MSLFHVALFRKHDCEVLQFNTENFQSQDYTKHVVYHFFTVQIDGAIEKAV